MSDEQKEQAARVQSLGTTRLEKAVEALVFAADEPVSGEHLARAYAEVTGEDVPSSEDVGAVIAAINGLYERTERAYRIESWAGGYRFATTADAAPFIQALRDTDRQRRLSRTLMETLAILAYRQPTSRTDIEFVRGVDCDYGLRKLMEYGLIDVVGRAETIGRPLLYGTTDRFLELFGLSTLENLPNLRELESILDDPAFQKEKARLLMTNGLQSLPGAGVRDGEEGENPEEQQEEREEEE